MQVYQAVKGTIDSYDALVDLLESIKHFLQRLEIYTTISPTAAMTEIVVKVFVELLSILALATKQIRQGRLSESVFDVLYYLTQRNAEKIVKKLLGENDIEAVLQRLDRLTQEEAQMNVTRTLAIVYGLFQNARVAMDGEQCMTPSNSRQLLSILSYRRQGIGTT